MTTDKLLKQLIGWLFFFKRKLILRRKISHIYSHISPDAVIPERIVKEHEKLWGRIGHGPDNRWLKIYTYLSSISDPSYITEIDFYNKIEPVLNNRAFSEAYADKNSYHRFIDKNLLTPVYLRNIHGSYYDESYNILSDMSDPGRFIPRQADKVIVKAAVESGGGRGVELFSRIGPIWKNKKNEVLTRKYLETIYKRNFLVQEYIEQHSFYSRFNHSSVNTIRLLTYRSVRTNEIIPLQAVFRIGKAGSLVDNQAAGGTACGISRDGVLNAFGINKMGDKIFSYGDIIFKDVGKLYLFEEIFKAGIEIAGLYPFQRLIGFDLCVDKDDNVKVIEVNNRNNEINFFQMNNGPLFREYTGEIIEYCKNNQRSFVIDFDF